MVRLSYVFVLQVMVLIALVVGVNLLVEAGDRYGICNGSFRKWRDMGEFGWRLYAKDLDEMKRAGVEWIRLDIDWQTTIELNYQNTDRRVKLYQERGINILGLLSAGTEMPEDMDAYRAWVRKTVTRYPQIRAWEIQNEPNLDQFWKGTAEQYVTLLKAAYQTIKVVDPALKVVLGGLSEWKAESFIDRLVAAKAWQWADIFGYHPYGSNPDRVEIRVLSAQRRMRGTPFADMPIWITEIGFCTALDWHVPGKVKTEEIKARYLREVYQRLPKIKNVEGPIFWYVFQEAHDTMGFGLFNRRIRVVALEIKEEKAYSEAYWVYQEMATGKTTREEIKRQTQ